MSKEQNVVNYYVLCNKLKDVIRTGWVDWKVNRERVESIAEHIYGVQMLAISIYYQFNYKLDLNKIIFMLAIHELEEIEIGDLAFFETTREEKLSKWKEATDYILKDFLGKDEISSLLRLKNLDDQKIMLKAWQVSFVCHNNMVRLSVAETLNNKKAI